MLNLYFNFTFLNIYVIPIYTLFFLTFILIHLNRRILNISKSVRVSSSSYSIISFKLLWYTSIPLLMIIVLNFLSFRSCEHLFFYSDCLNFYFYQKFFLLLFVIFLLKNIIIANSLVFKTSQNYYSEIIIAIWWIFFIVIWSLSINSLISFIILIEVLNLLILILIYYTFIVNRSYSNIFLNYKFINLQFSVKSSFVLSILFFIWCSAITLLLLFWSLSQILVLAHSLNITFLELTLYFNLAWSGWLNLYSVVLPLFILFFCLLLKIAILPMQFWLISFYKNFPLISLVFYLLFFYIYSIIIFFNCFFWLFLFFSSFLVYILFSIYAFFIFFYIY